MKKIYGFENYKHVFLFDYLLKNGKVEPYYFHGEGNGWGNDYILFPIDKDIYVNAGGNIKWDSINNNKDILDTAKTLYVHPSCKISRSIVAQKYKKSLSPWTADAVAIPNPAKENSYSFVNTAVFVNEPKKLLVVFGRVSYNDLIDMFNNLEKGTKFHQLLTANQLDAIARIPNFTTTYGYASEDMLNAQFDYFGNFFYSEKKDRYIIDCLNGVLPKNKLVFEDSVMASLSSEENIPTFETMVSIKEMLCSSDNDSQGSAIKALSAMDYINYPNSVKYILDISHGVPSWVYNKAADTTAAKYMFKFLIGGTARHSIKFNSGTITSKDYDLLKQLVRHFNNNDDYKTMEYLRVLPFTYEDEKYNVFPRIID